MKRILTVITVISVGLLLAGCGKKKETLESMQEPMSIDTLSALTSEQQNATAVSTTNAAEAMVAPAPVQSATTLAQPSPVQTTTSKAKLEPLPPQGPYKPTGKEIQTALKNAGFYTGEVDGKVGPMTKKAIEEFQKAKGLTPDGKVGVKTWNLLGAYLESAAGAKSTKR